MKRIWLNHWFSTAYNIIRLIRESDPGYTIIGTNENEEAPIRAVCDEWYREPKLKGREYADYCLDFCLLGFYIFDDSAGGNRKSGSDRPAGNCKKCSARL